MSDLGYAQAHDISIEDRYTAVPLLKGKVVVKPHYRDLHEPSSFGPFGGSFLSKRPSSLSKSSSSWKSL